MSISPNHPPGSTQADWNQAHDRLHAYLLTFALGNHEQTSRLTLQLLDEARELHRRNPSIAPVSLVMELAQKRLDEWFDANLEMKDRVPSRLRTSGCVALLLSGAFRTAPETFLSPEPSENLKETLQQTLLVTGPDLDISSMTPRHLDYGPMLDLAKRTWHRWKAQEVVFALLFWAGVYFIFHWWLSETL